MASTSTAPTPRTELTRSKPLQTIDGIPVFVEPLPLANTFVYIQLHHGVPGPPSATPSTALPGANGHDYHPCLVVSCVPRDNSFDLNLLVCRSFKGTYTLAQKIDFISREPDPHLYIPIRPTQESLSVVPPTPADFGEPIEMNPGYSWMYHTWLHAVPVTHTVEADQQFKTFPPHVRVRPTEFSRIQAYLYRVHSASSTTRNNRGRGGGSGHGGHTGGAPGGRGGPGGSGRRGRRGRGRDGSAGRKHRGQRDTGAGPNADREGGISANGTVHPGRGCPSFDVHTLDAFWRKSELPPEGISYRYDDRYGYMPVFYFPHHDGASDDTDGINDIADWRDDGYFPQEEIWRTLAPVDPTSAANLAYYEKSRQDALLSKIEAWRVNTTDDTPDEDTLEQSPPIRV